MGSGGVSAAGARAARHAVTLQTPTPNRPSAAPAASCQPCRGCSCTKAAASCGQRGSASARTSRVYPIERQRGVASDLQQADRGAPVNHLLEDGGVCGSRRNRGCQHPCSPGLVAEAAPGGCVWRRRLPSLPASSRCSPERSRMVSPRASMTMGSSYICQSLGLMIMSSARRVAAKGGSRQRTPGRGGATPWVGGAGSAKTSGLRLTAQHDIARVVEEGRKQEAPVHDGNSGALLEGRPGAVWWAASCQGPGSCSRQPEQRAEPQEAAAGRHAE